MTSRHQHYLERKESLPPNTQSGVYRCTIYHQPGHKLDPPTFSKHFFSDRATHTFAPWWAPNFTINISGSKEASKLLHENTMCNDDTLYVYTDGSGIDGQVGAAAYSPTTLSTKQQCLGSENQHNIYSAELTAIEIAVNIAQTCQNNYKQCVIYADSQAAIKATVKPGRQSGQSILCSLLSSIDNYIYYEFTEY